MKKKFVLTAEVVDDHITITGENDGFNAYELIGILHEKILDIDNQLHNADLYTHTRSYKRDGQVIEVTEKEKEDAAN